jgi:hypothetical protein
MNDDELKLRLFVYPKTEWHFEPQERLGKSSTRIALWSV